MVEFFIFQALLKERDAMRAKVHKFRTEVYGTVQKQSVVENTHKASRARLFYFHKKYAIINSKLKLRILTLLFSDVEKRWKKINKNVTIGILLAPSATSKQEKIFWRLSAYETNKRMRKVFIILFTNHNNFSPIDRLWQLTCMAQIIVSIV